MPAVSNPGPGIVAAQLARVADQGSGRHSYRDALVSASGPSSARDLADAIHLLCAIHGRFPGLADLAMANAPIGPIRDWLRTSADSFDRERLYLVRLTASVGPIPSTPGAAQTESALVAQRHAIETLAKSERRGCALGAAVAMVQDWKAIRPILDHAATRSGLECPQCTLPDDDSVASVMAEGVEGMASERAVSFGADQLVLQHRALFDLLQARAEARELY